MGPRAARRVQARLLQRRAQALPLRRAARRTRSRTQERPFGPRARRRHSRRDGSRRRSRRRTTPAVRASSSRSQGVNRRASPRSRSKRRGLLRPALHAPTFSRLGPGGLNRQVRQRYAPAVATILLCGVDVYFRGKLEVLLPGHHFVTTDSADWPDLVIADISRVDPMDVADWYPEIPILGFGGHADTAGLRRAHEAGFDQVLVKNALQERAAQVVEELTA